MLTWIIIQFFQFKHSRKPESLGLCISALTLFHIEMSDKESSVNSRALLSFKRGKKTVYIP